MGDSHATTDGLLGEADGARVPSPGIPLFRDDGRPGKSSRTRQSGGNSSGGNNSGNINSSNNNTSQHYTIGKSTSRSQNLNLVILTTTKGSYIKGNRKFLSSLS